ncbi:MAG: hypothetical protein ABJQ29_12735 [Luteolibacter sp.]
MTDNLFRVAEALGRPLHGMHVLARSGKPLLALPSGREAALRTLRLYQPQRGLAKLTACLLRAACTFGAHRILLPKASVGATEASGNLLPGETDPESVGVLFGSSEHRVFRAVLSYCNGGNWEVGKLAAGEDGATMLEREAQAIQRISPRVPEAPELLGLEEAGNARLLRMPYFRGCPLQPGDTQPIRRLLDSWLSNSSARPLESFPEWAAISAGLGIIPGGERIIERIAKLPLLPSIRHGDLARWNLLTTETGELKVLDWEWGEPDGMPGIDLVHFIAQDLRLVQRLPDAMVFRKTLDELRQPLWRDYLVRCGWQGHESEMIIACLAFKQGAGHQENRPILEACAIESSQG